MCLWCGNVVPDGSNWQIFVYSFNIWINQNLGSEKPFREQHKNAEISTKMWSDFVALASFHWHCVMKESVVVVTMKIAISSLEKKTWIQLSFKGLCRGGFIQHLRFETKIRQIKRFAFSRFFPSSTPMNRMTVM